jgi:hypothetical protein
MVVLLLAFVGVMVCFSHPLIDDELTLCSGKQAPPWPHFPVFWRTSNSIPQPVKFNQ